MSGVALLIIAGGRSSRLGVDKRFVEVGGVGMLENILRKASARNFAEKFLCVEENSPALKTLADTYGAELLLDTEKAAGPIAGLAGGLARIKSDWALALSADMPFFHFDALQPLTKKFSSAQAIIPVVGTRKQMLAAFYRRELASLFETDMRLGQRRLSRTIERVSREFVPLADETPFFNVNTPADLRQARGRAINLSRRIPLISIVAPASGTGKTTFIERLIKNLSAQGIRVGAVKSDAHGFNLDVEGKDSYRFQTAGARSVAVVSPDGWFMIQRNEHENFQRVVEMMTGVDLILTESRTHATFPAISLWRGRGEVIETEKVAAIFTSAFDETARSNEIRRYDLDDALAAETVCKFLGGL